MTLQLLVLYIPTGLCLFLSGCSQVTIKDEIYYGLKYPGDGAVMAHTLTTPTADLTEAQWEATIEQLLLQGKVMICTSSDSVADAKAIQEQLCSWNPSECNYDTTQATQSFFTRFETMKKRLKKRK